MAIRSSAWAHPDDLRRDTVKSQGDLPVRSNRKLDESRRRRSRDRDHPRAPRHRLPVVKDLEQLLPTHLDMTANESANALVLTDTRRTFTACRDRYGAGTARFRACPRCAFFRCNMRTRRTWRPRQGLVCHDDHGQTTPAAAAAGAVLHMFRGGGFPARRAPTLRARAAGQYEGRGRGGRALEFPGRERAPDLMTTIADMVKEIDQPVSDITELRSFIC